MSLLLKICCALGFTFLFLCTPQLTYAQTNGAKWESSRSDNGTRYLTYSASSALLGKTTPVSVSFFCDPSPSKNDVHGAIGFDFYVGDVAKLKPFNFEDFEGPDAKTGKLMRVTVNRNGKPALTFNVVPSGSTPSEGRFVFGIAELSRTASSEPKSILKALSDNAESMQITVTDSRNAKLKLELTVPVSDKQADFKVLLAGLK